jgi:hypothetical protein
VLDERSLGTNGERAEPVDHLLVVATVAVNHCSVVSRVVPGLGKTAVAALVLLLQRMLLLPMVAAVVGRWKKKKKKIVLSQVPFLISIAQSR